MNYTASFKPRLIYVFRINDALHRGCLKIGEATCKEGDITHLTPSCKALNAAAKVRIDQYTKTAGISYELLYTELTLHLSDGQFKSFNDKQVHDILRRSGVKKKDFGTGAGEWFITDLETVKHAIQAAKQGRSSLFAGEISKGNDPIVFRPEQREAIDKTVHRFKKGKRMLWNAKMRFGKTLSALQVVKELGYAKTLILTHRPVVDAGWFEDFGKIFTDNDYVYSSRRQGEAASNLQSLAAQGKRYIYFASMQDLRGSQLVGGHFDKNDEIFSTDWDLIIIDEAHEGTQTELGQSVINELLKSETRLLQLSGTPFNLLDDYNEEEIYTWDYVMEQRAKAQWDLTHCGDPNPYSTLPKMNIYTFDLGKIMRQYIDEDVAFNFHEFFRVNGEGQFIHKQDVAKFLDLICKNDDKSNYPYSTQAYRCNFRHSLWMLPGVKAAKALSKMLQNHPVFSFFKVVNVAGDGDEEQESNDALQAVRQAIGNNPDETYTITLSCGRLTTGVTVKEWTAVFMLAGSYNTAASTYMQTIFRVQSPAIVNGRVKEECFVFDFAPDRTLKVLAETAKISAKAGKTTHEDRLIMEEFLNFCPVISYNGTRMQSYDVPRMLEQLKQVQIERVVRNGFEDGQLYNEQLLRLSDMDLKDFSTLKGIIGQTRALPKSNDIELNKQGFDGDLYKNAAEADKKKRQKKELTDDEKKALAQLNLKKKQRLDAISILRGISIRMPLLIYGAQLTDENQEITIQNFANLIDDLSWREFMPPKVTKELFAQFTKYYDEDIFHAAGLRIRALARSADKLSIEERIARITGIFANFRNPDKETVLTPWRVVNMHLGDCLGGYNFYDEQHHTVLETPRYIDHGEVTANVFSPDSRILEINSKSGLYPLYMAYSIYRQRLAAIEKTDGEQNATQRESLWLKVIAENIFVICKTPMAKAITRRTLVGFNESAKVNTRYFEDLINQITNKSQQFVKRVRDGKGYWNANNDRNMKFNAIVGNPPYQIMDGGAAGGALPLYDKFVNISKIISPIYISMIMPSRWFAGGRGLDLFREEMMKDKHIRYIKNYPKSRDCFNNVDIAGGICYLLWQEKTTEKCHFVTSQNDYETSSYRTLDEFNIIIRYDEGVQIIRKIKNDEFKSVEDLVASVSPFGLRSFVRGKEKPFKNSVLLHSSAGISYIPITDVRNGQELIPKYKVVVGYLNPDRAGVNNSTNGSNVTTKISLYGPNEVITETYIVIGSFSSKDNALCYEKYMKTKFVRLLVFLTLSSMHITKLNYQFVPMQDFTAESDIDWSQRVAQIDQQLYHKYGLTDDEVAFVERMIKPME